MRAARGQAAGAASPQTGTSLAAHYQRWVNRRGQQQAVGAVGHRMLRMVYRVLQTRVPSQDLGGASCERRPVSTPRQRLIRPLDARGVQVTGAEVTEAAYPHRQYFHCSPA